MFVSFSSVFQNRSSRLAGPAMVKRLTLLGVVAFYLAFQICPIHAKEPKPVSKAIEVGHRPANSYRLRFARDPDVCDPVLTALNKPHTITREPNSHWFNINWTRDTAMGNELEVQWTPRSFTYDTGELRTDVLQSAVVDIDNDGTREIVYRFSWMRSDRLYDSIWVTPWFTSSHLSTDVIDHETIKTKIFVADEGLARYALEIGSSTVPEIWEMAYAEAPHNFQIIRRYVGTVVDVRGKNYFLIENWQRPPEAASVFLLEFHAIRKYSVLCQFRQRVSKS